MVRPLFAHDGAKAVQAVVVAPRGKACGASVDDLGGGFEVALGVGGEMHTVTTVASTFGMEFEMKPGPVLMGQARLAIDFIAH